MPMMELTAVALTVKVVNQLKGELPLRIDKDVFWSDSQVSEKSERNSSKICFDINTDDQAKINDEIKIFFEEAFECRNSKSFTSLSNILNSIDLPCLTNEQKYFCEIELGVKELLNALKSMPNNKTPGNGGLSKAIFAGRF